LTLVAGGAACSVVEAVMARLLTLDAAVPELALGVALYAALRLDPLTGGLVAFSVGYLGDLSSGSPRGLEATALVLVALLARTSTERLFVSGPAFVAGFAGVASLLKNGIVALLLRLVVRLRYPAWPDWLGFGEIVRLALLQATATALLAPVSFAWARRIHRRWVGPRSALVASFDGPLE
jgi:rod shape-determining protein MreD